MNPSCLRVLLAEDDTLLAADLEACLRAAGHEVLAVEACGDSALKAAHLLQPDVVVLNVCLRGSLDGAAVATALRAGRPMPVPVVFITALAEVPGLLRRDAAVPRPIQTRPLVGQHLCQALHTALNDMWR